MSVLSFRSLVRTVAQPRDWSTQEVADFYRAYDLLRRHGVNIGIDRGLTDKGEPWLVFFDAASQDVFLHMARIDDVCILVSDVLGINFKARSIPDLIAKLDESVRGLVVERAERDSNVVMHPAARIIMAVSAVFLLFKFDKGGSAYAKSESATTTLDSVMRKQEASLQARLQANIGRLLESADTPAAIAATAGVLLTAELMRLVKDQVVREAAAEETGAATQLAELGPIELHEREGGPEEVAPLADSHIQNLAEMVGMAVAEVSAGDATLADELADIAHDMLKAVEGAIVGRAHAAERPEPAKMVAEALLPSPAPKVAAREMPAGEAAPEASSTPRPASSTTPVVTPGEAGESTLIRLPVAVTPVAEVGEAVDDESSVPAIWQGGEIVMSDLASLARQAGLYRLTEMSGREAVDVLQYVYDHVGSYERERDGKGSVMLEQDGLAGLDAAKIGLWQNVFADGTVLSVVGSVTFLDSLSELL